MNSREILNEVMTVAEISKKYNVTQTTVKNWCSGQKGLPPLLSASDCRQSGKTWLILRKSAEKLAQRKTRRSFKNNKHGL